MDAAAATRPQKISVMAATEAGESSEDEWSASETMMNRPPRHEHAYPGARALLLEYPGRP
jgi:hypothetical protein